MTNKSLIGRLKTALKDSATECHRHNCEYHHETPSSTISAWLALVEETTAEAVQNEENIPFDSPEHRRRFQDYFANFHKKWTPDTPEKRAEFMAEILLLFRFAMHKGPAERQ